MKRFKYLFRNTRSFLVHFSFLFLFAFLTVNAQSSNTFQVAILEFSVVPLGGSIEGINVGQAMSLFLERELVNSPRFVVIERANLEDIIGEIRLSEEGLVSLDEAKRYGEFKSVDIVVYGDIVAYPDSFDVTARFVEVSSSQISESFDAQTPNIQELSEIARGFVSEAEARFPLAGEVLEVRGDTAFINLGTDNGLTSNMSRGVILRSTEVAGRQFSEEIGQFEVDRIDDSLSRIVPTMDEGFDLQVGDVIRLSSPKQTTTNPILSQEQEAESIDSSEAVAEPPEEISTPIVEVTKLVVTTKDVNADVFLNDDLVGSTPLELFDLAAGVYLLELRAADFEVFREAISIEVGQETIRDISLQALASSEPEVVTSEQSSEPQVPTPPSTETEEAQVPSQEVSTSEAHSPEVSSEVDTSSESKTQELTTQEGALELGEGWLNLTTNLPNAQVNLIPVLGGEELLVSIPKNQLKVVLPKGFYDVFASADGGRAFQEAIDIKEGQENTLNLSFEELSLSSSLSLGTMNNFGFLDVLLAGTLSDADLAAIRSLSILGPEGWNDNEVLSFAPEFTSLLEWEAEVLPGDYVLRYNLGAGEISQSFYLDDQSRLAEVTGLDINIISLNQLDVSWRKPAESIYYFVYLFSEDSDLAYEETAASKLTFEALNLNRAETYEVCITALNWQPGGAELEDILKGSFSCTDFTVPVSSSSSNNSSPTPKPDGGPLCPECDDF